MQAENGIESGTGIAEPVVTDPILPEPASPADDQNGKPAATDESADQETTEQQEAKKQSKWARRLDRHKAEKVAAQTEARMLREQLAKLEAQPKATQETGPQRDQFENLEDYLKAVTKHEAAQLIDGRLKTEREDREKQESSRKASVTEERVAKDWTERETSFQEATKDYGESVSSYIEDEINTLSDVARRSILESEVGPQLLYHLAKNPDEAERIADLSPVRQVAELGKLEAKMAPAPKKSSNAPAPIKPVNSGRSAPHGYSENMSDTEYKTWRKTQGARWAR